MHARLVHACRDLHNDAELVLTLCMHITQWPALDYAASGLALASASSIRCKAVGTQSNTLAWNACNQSMAGGVTELVTSLWQGASQSL